MNLRRLPLRAFTLVELMLVLVILVILASVIFPQLSKQPDVAKVKAARADLSMLETALDLFMTNCGRYPTGDEGLLALVEGSGIDGWHGPYVKVLRKDPWGTPYVYQAPGVHFPDTFDLYSVGADRTEGNDDVVNWE